MMRSILKIDVFPDVYPPAEDTFLLLDSIDTKPSDRALEVGSGTGYVALHLCQAVSQVIAIDISFAAVRNTIANVRTNSLQNKCTVIQSEMLTGLSPREKFSIIAFNPPYLPAEEGGTSLDHALIGGEVGIELTERFIRQAVEYLQPEGRLYVVVSSLADVETIERVMNSCSLSTEIVGETPLFFEKLQIMRGVLKN
ncbi:MAG: tRNA (adenine(22)-N(1))-methyltransferase TrmK [Candidatus Thorarchaeota archaeon]|nr:tRNA (adenine(22)-N(1))-methyltransferase TrmK [Candidatus Thorarchaeota archaeon]MCK5238661.1 tRNA (adenine(22)-N(1))-methyltransferase TrmK [Candidatus Thorarchaeota archaeon]